MVLPWQEGSGGLVGSHWGISLGLWGLNCFALLVFPFGLEPKFLKACICQFCQQPQDSEITKRN